MVGKFLMTFSFALVVACASFSYNNSQETPTARKEENKMTCCCSSPICYSSSARIDVNKKWDFYLSASFIYWKAKEDGLVVAGLLDRNTLPQVLSFTDMNFEYKPGFKIGLGMNSGCYDNWMINGEYTHLHSTHHAVASVPEIWGVALRPNFLSLEIDFNIPPYDGYSFLRSEGTWKNKIDLIDLYLSRPFYSGTKLILSPFFGLRGGWMDQCYFGNYLATSLSTLDTLYTLSSKSKQNTWLIGPRAGLCSQWLLGCNFRIFSDIAAALCYQKFDNKFQDFDELGPFDFASKKRETLTPNLQMNLGLGYGTYFACRKWHFDLSVSYDFQVFWNQNRMSTLVSDESTIAVPFFFDVAKIHDLYLYGLTVSARLDF
jgi:hypothetical protein